MGFSFNANRHELLFFPRYHLDQSSLLLRKPLLGKPMVMDVFEDYLLVTYRPFDIHIFQAKLFGELSPSSSPVLQVTQYTHRFYEHCIGQFEIDRF